MIFNNLTVQKYKLEDICKITSGFVFKSKKYKESGKPIIRAGNLKGNEIDDSSLVYFDERDYGRNLDRHIIRPMDVLIVNVGSNCGDISLNQLDRSFHFNQNVWNLNPNLEIVNRRYLFHFLLSIHNDIQGCISSSTTQPVLNKSKFSKLEIPIPPMNVQIEVADRLDTFREIEREIALRNKQYEYYRNFLIGK